MAAHIESVSGSGIRRVSRGGFYSSMRNGDLVFCSGSAAVSKAIEGVTHSPFSHVLMAWLPPDADRWLTIESTLTRGVHVGQMSSYVEEYEGDLVLARRPVMAGGDLRRALDAGLAVLDDGYDWKQEASMVGHRLLKCIPVEIPKKEYYCSGLLYWMSLATRFPLTRPGVNYPTPEDLWVDPTVEPVCALVRNGVQIHSTPA